MSPKAGFQRLDHVWYRGFKQDITHPKPLWFYHPDWTLVDILDIR
jgi:hypothetical protein